MIQEYLNTYVTLQQAQQQFTIANRVLTNAKAMFSNIWSSRGPYHVKCVHTPYTKGGYAIYNGKAILTAYSKRTTALFKAATLNYALYIKENPQDVKPL
jgi:hypothetical protein